MDPYVSTLINKTKKLGEPSFPEDELPVMPGSGRGPVGESRPRYLLVLLKVTEQDIHKCFSQFRTVSNKSNPDFFQTLLVCGEQRVLMCLHIDEPFPAGTKSPSSLEWKDGTDDLNWLYGIRELLTSFLKGIELSSDSLRPPGATDRIMVQDRSPKDSSDTIERGYCHPTEPEIELPWTTEEKRILVMLRSKKTSFAEIGRKLGRTELQVACKYIEIVPFPTSRSVRNIPSVRESQLEYAGERGASRSILWLTGALVFWG
jgi:hypothetical protein